MKRVPVKSSQIESIGYDPEQCVLEIEFKGKTKHSVYRYYKVDSETHAQMMTAESKGVFLGQKIKGTFAFEKIETFDKPLETESEVA